MEKLYRIIRGIKPLDEKKMDQAQKRLDSLTKPKGSLGRLEDLVKQVVGITAKLKFGLKRKAIFTFAGDHGVADEGVSAFPREVTAQMVYNFLRGGAAINVFPPHGVVVVADLGVTCDLKKNKS